MTEKPELVIIGAGPAGLAAGLFAAQNGRSVEIFESSKEVGGLAASHKIDGLSVDAGSHRLHPAADPAVLELLQKLLGKDLQLRPRKGRVRLANRWAQFPLNAVNLAITMPPTWLARITCDLAGATWRNRKQPPADSYATGIRNGLGNTAYESLYGPYATKMWGLSGTDIDPEQARVRVSANSPTSLIKRIIGSTVKSAVRSKTTTAPRGTTFWYPRNGFGQISTALADAATAAGVTITCADPVTSITPGEKPTVTTASGNQITTTRVLSTLPATVLINLITPAAPSQITTHANALQNRAMILVYLTHQPKNAVRPVQWTSYDAHYLPDTTTAITRISEPRNYRNNPEDPSDRTILCAEIPCAVGDQLWTATDTDLGDLVEQTLVQHELPPVTRTKVTVRRITAAYPIYRHGYREHLDAVEDWLHHLPGVTTFGRAGLFAHDNTHHALVMARAVADCVGPQGAFDDVAWAVARQSFRKHVVED